MPTHYEQVLEFFHAFQQALPPADSEPSLENDVIKERISLKMDLIFEEFQELVEAVYGEKSAEKLNNAWKLVKLYDDGNRDVVETADALADLSYVTHGLAIEANIPLDRVFEHVHQSNMSKLGADGLPVLSDGETPASDGQVKPKGKILKGENYWAPNIKKVLGLEETN